MISIKKVLEALTARSQDYCITRTVSVTQNWVVGRTAIASTALKNVPVVDGYTPVGVVGAVGSDNFIEVVTSLSNGSLNGHVWNSWTSEQSATVTITVLYQRN